MIYLFRYVGARNYVRVWVAFVIYGADPNCV